MQQALESYFGILLYYSSQEAKVVSRNLKKMVAKLVQEKPFRKVLGRFQSNKTGRRY